MSTPTFGWVITPAARDASGTDALHDNNRRFVEHIRGVFDTIWVEDHFQWNERPVGGQVVVTYEFADLAAWAAWRAHEDVQKAIDEAYPLLLNLTAELWGPSPVVPAPIRPGK